MDSSNIIQIILEAIDKNTAQVTTAAANNIRQIGTATKLTSDQQKELDKDFDRLMRRIDPLYAATQRYAESQQILNRGLAAGLINQQQYAQGLRLIKEEAANTSVALGGIGAAGGTLIGLGIGSVLAGIAREAVTAAQEAERATVRLEAILNATGGVAGKTSSELNSLADAMARTTEFDDEAWRGAIGTLLTFRNVSGETFDRATKAVGDLAATMGTDLQSAALKVGKALEDPEVGLTALTRSGISFSQSQKEVIKRMVETGDSAGAMNIILQEIEGQIGGVAEQMNTGLTKSSTDASKAFDELMETLGVKGASAASGVLSFITDELKEMKDIADNGDWLDRLLYTAKFMAGAVPGLALPDVNPDAQEQMADASEREKKAKAEIAAIDRQIEDVTERRSKLEKAISDQLQERAQQSLKEESEDLKEKIGGYDRLRLAMIRAYEEAGKSADAANDRAQAFLDRAKKTLADAQGKLQDREIRNASPEEADALRQRAIQEALDKARSARIDADYQRLLGNSEQAERQLDLSDEQIERASKLADALKDEGQAQREILNVAEASARNDESRARIEEQRAQKATQLQQDLNKQIQDNDQRLETLRTQLSSIEDQLKKLTSEPATVKLQADQEAFSKINNQLDELLRKKALLASNDPNFTGVYDSNGNAVYRDPAGGASGNFMLGGPVFGKGPKGVDSVAAYLAPGEHVWDDEDVDGAGGHAAVYRLRWLARRGLLPRFDIGGEVGASYQQRSALSRMNLPASTSIPPIDRYGDTINLTMPGFGTYTLKTMRATSKQLQSDIARAALMHGGLKQ